MILCIGVRVETLYGAPPGRELSDTKERKFTMKKLS